MHIIKIKAFENGSHDNQNGGLATIPEGWAIIPDDMIIPETYPFVDIEVEGQTVVKMTAGVMPEPAPEPTPEVDLQQRIAELEKQLNELKTLAEVTS